MRHALHAAPVLPLAVLLAASHPAAADPFAIADALRTLDASLEVEVGTPLLLEPPRLESLGPGTWEATRHLGPLTTGDPEDALASGELSVSQQSFIGTNALSFAATADGFATGSRTTQFGVYRVFAIADTTYDVTFDLATVVPVQLTMDSEVVTGPEFPFSRFDFELSRDGVIVWTDEVKRDPVTGAETRSFTQTLLLQPGHYALSAVVHVQAVVSPDVAVVHDRVFADFTLTAVPEPQSWASMLAGIALLGALLSDSRRVPPA